MALRSGTKLSPSEIQSAVGASGIHSDGVIDVIATHDGEIGLERCNFADGRIATMRDIQLDSSNSHDPR